MRRFLDWRWAVWAFLLVCAIDAKYQTIGWRGAYLLDRSQIAGIPADLNSVPPTFKPYGGSDKLSKTVLDAGIQQGDILREINGVPIKNRTDVRRFVDRGRPGDVLQMVLERKGQRVGPLSLKLTTPRNVNVERIVFLVFLQIVMPLLFVTVGFFVCAKRIHDERAWAVFLMLLGFSTFFELAAVWNPMSGFLYNVYQSITATIWPFAMLWFATTFPHRLALPKWLHYAFQTVIGSAVPIFTLVLVTSLLDEISFGLAEPFFQLVVTLSPFISILYFIAITAFFALLWYRRTNKKTSPDSKRRLGLLLWGANISFTPLLLLLGYQAIGTRTPLPALPDWVALTVWSLVAIFPLVLAYVVVVDRAMELGVVLRAGFRYALARGGVAVAIALITAALLFLPGVLEDEAALSRPQRIQRGALVIVAVLVLIRVRNKAFQWVDKRFFREAYNADKILLDLSQNIRGILDRNELFSTLSSSVQESLHVPCLGVLTRQGDQYTIAHWRGDAMQPDVSISANSGIVQELHKHKSPLKVYFDDERSWIYSAEVTDEDRAQLQAMGTQLLVPLCGRDELLGFLSLGPKRSEVPYSRNDNQLLQTVGNQTALSLENARLTEQVAVEAATRERLNRELEIAREVQTRLFPHKRVPVDGVDYFGYCRPALGVGGDYYDFIELPNGMFGIAIGDVSGKGIGAALTMASLQASLRAQTIDPTNDLARVLNNINRLLFEASASNRYATFFYAQYDPLTRRLAYVNAGHNAPMLMRRGKLERLNAGGVVIGLLPKYSYEQAVIEVEPGDLLVAYTDGISEAMNRADEEWGEDRLCDLVLTMEQACCSEVVQEVLRAADAHINGAPQHDDMTLLAVRF